MFLDIISNIVQALLGIAIGVGIIKGVGYLMGRILFQQK